MKITLFIKILLLFSIYSNLLEAIDFNITPPLSLTTTENGGSATFQVGLNSYPASPDENVTIYAYTNNKDEARFSGITEYTFYSILGVSQRAFTIRGLSDGVIDGNTSYDVTFSTQRVSMFEDTLPVFDSTK